jgi:hypothetical protein
MKLILALLLAAPAQPFTTPRTSTRRQVQHKAFLDDDDGSIWDTLLRNGPISFGIRVARPDFYEEKVVTYMETKAVDRLEAQRRMDFMFNDPNGFGVNELREEQLDEKINYNIKSGVQNRPVFSAFWASWCFYFFFIFLPARVNELGGISLEGSKFDLLGPYT